MPIPSVHRSTTPRLVTPHKSRGYTIGTALLHHAQLQMCLNSPKSPSCCQYSTHRSCRRTRLAKLVLTIFFNINNPPLPRTTLGDSSLNGSTTAPQGHLMHTGVWKEYTHSSLCTLSPPLGTRMEVKSLLCSASILPQRSRLQLGCIKGRKLLQEFPPEIV